MFESYLQAPPHRLCLMLYKQQVLIRQRSRTFSPALWTGAYQYQAEEPWGPPR